MTKSKVINWKRLSAALFVGAAATSMILGALHYWIGFPIGRIHPTLVHLPFHALTYLIVILSLVIIVGIPTIFILNRLGLFNRAVVLIIGTLVGTACIIPSIGPQPPPYAKALLFCFGGFLMSALFWWVYAGANKQHNADSGAVASPPVR